MKKSKEFKFKASFANVPKGKDKSATRGYEARGFESLKKFAKALVTHASVPVFLKDGYRDYDHVEKIYDWMRFDCDEAGEAETIMSALRQNNIMFINVPSTNWHPKHKPYKRHIHVVTSKTSQDVVKYKYQVKMAMSDLGFPLSDRRVTEVCVQNCNPYKHGNIDSVIINEGEPYKLCKPPKYIKYNPMQKTIFNGKGASDIISKKVTNVTGKLTHLSPKSGIMVDKVGWVQLRSLNLDVGGIIGGLSCPAHNHNHQGGAYKTGYAFATMDEGGDVWVNCTGAECKDKHYKVTQDNYGADTKVTDLYRLRNLLKMSAYDIKSNTYYYMDDKGSVRGFKASDVMNHWSRDIFFKVDMSLSDEVEATVSKLRAKMKTDKSDIVDNSSGNYKHLNKIDSVTSTNAITKLTEVFNGDAKRAKKFMKDNSGEDGAFDEQLYIDKVLNTVLIHLRTFKQFDSIEYRIDPYASEATGSFKNSVWTITLNQALSELKEGTPNASYVKDYKKHNPYLDDMIDMIVLQRMGASSKRSYLWLRASSNWGKSLLFNVMMGEDGLSYVIKESEIKNALSGAPSGLEPSAMARSSVLFFDEFKSAVSELKDISHQMSVTPKNKSKVTVPVFMKVFASAEDVKSLNGSAGMDDQYRNRFLFIRVDGDLEGRPKFNKHRSAYIKAVSLYINQVSHAKIDRFINLGAVEGTKVASVEYEALADRYTIKNHTESLSDNIPTLFKEWLEVNEQEHLTDTSVIIRKGVMYIVSSKLEKLYESFVKASFTERQWGAMMYKDPRDVLDADTTRTIKLRGKSVRVRYFSNKGYELVRGRWVKI